MKIKLLNKNILRYLDNYLNDNCIVYYDYNENFVKEDSCKIYLLNDEKHIRIELADGNHHRSFDALSIYTKDDLHLLDIENASFDMFYTGFGVIYLDIFYDYRKIKEKFS